jgi:hypothetical protein
LQKFSPNHSAFVQQSFVRIHFNLPKISLDKKRQGKNNLPNSVSINYLQVHDGSSHEPKYRTCFEVICIEQKIQIANLLSLKKRYSLSERSELRFWDSRRILLFETAAC